MTVHVTDVLQSSSLFLVKFQTFEGTADSSEKYVNESKCTCLAADCIYMGKVNVTKFVTIYASRQRNNTKVFAHLPASSKTRLPKQCPC